MLEPLLASILILIPLPEGRVQDCGYRVLSPGSFHGDEVKAKDGESWFGLYDIESGCCLSITELQIEPALDPYFDREDERTGKLVSADDGDGEPLFLLRPMDSPFQEGPVTTVLVNSPVLLPDTTISLGAFGSLFTTEKGLFLTDGEIVQRLSDVYPEPYGEHVFVVWAGDLDGDGLVDVMLDDQPHYAYNQRLVLFLSSEADRYSLVKEVAVFTAVSC